MSTCHCVSEVLWLERLCSVVSLTLARHKHLPLAEPIKYFFFFKLECSFLNLVRLGKEPQWSKGRSEGLQVLFPPPPERDLALLPSFPSWRGH